MYVYLLKYVFFDITLLLYGLVIVRSFYWYISNKKYFSWRRESHRFNIDYVSSKNSFLQQCTAAISETSGHDQWDDPLSFIDPRWCHRPEWLPARKALCQRALEPQKGWCHYLTAHLIAQSLKLHNETILS